MTLSRWFVLKNKCTFFNFCRILMFTFESLFRFRLQRFEKTNEMLVNCNALSQVHLQKANQEFKKHISLLNDMKKDLDNIFKRVRALKSKVAGQYPQAFKGTLFHIRSLDFERGDIYFSIFTHFFLRCIIPGTTSCWRGGEFSIQSCARYLLTI